MVGRQAIIRAGIYDYAGLLGRARTVLAATLPAMQWSPSFGDLGLLVEALDLASQIVADAVEHQQTGERFATRSETVRHGGATLVRYHKSPFSAAVCKSCGRLVTECGATSEAKCRAAFGAEIELSSDP